MGVEKLMVLEVKLLHYALNLNNGSLRVCWGRGGRRCEGAV